MLDLKKEIDSLTNFRRQSAEYLDHLQSTGDPLVLTVNGKAMVVAQDAEAYQKLVDAASKADREETVSAIRDGLADVEAVRTNPARAASKALAKKYGISSTEK